MKVNEYLKRINIICIDHEDRCKPGGCPLHEFGCGVPKDTEKISEVIKIVEEYEKKAIELKPCPFCGGDGVMEPMKVRKGFEAVVHCNGNCLASVHTITYDSEPEAIKAAIESWNART